jgi:hypothetical protein
MRSSAQSIGNYVFFAQVIVDYKIIIFDKLQPSLLSKVDIWLSENALQTFVVRVDFTSLSYQIVPPYLESMNNYC